jgi:hypothetical protein
MPKISPFQMTEAKSWAGITSKNHVGAIFGNEPQKASKMLTRIAQTNFGLDLDSYLDQFDPMYLDTDDDFTWDLVGSGKKNVPLVEARIGGAAITGASQPGLAFTEFEMVFPEQWFTDEHVIVGHKNEIYQLQIQNDPIPEGTEWVYKVKLLTGDPTLFVPSEELAANTRWSKDFSLVEQELSKKGGGINFTSPFKMRNAFSMIRMQHTCAGNMINRPMGTKWLGEEGKTYTTWTQYEDYEFEKQYREEKNRLIMYSRSNKKDDGSYANKGKSGNIKKQGAGLRQQMEASNTVAYSVFNIDFLLDVLLELSEGKLPTDAREFIMLTGERGAVQFHEAIENYSQLFTKMNDGSRIYGSKSANGAKMPLGYGGQFVEYMGPQGIKVTLKVHSMYDDRERNKIYHPGGGVAESYRYDIMDVGTSDGEPNIRKVYVKGQEDFMGYQTGLRNPFDAAGGRNVMSSSTDGYTIHRGSMCGIMVKDPSRTATLLPNLLV